MSSFEVESNLISSLFFLKNHIGLRDESIFKVSLMTGKTVEVGYGNVERVRIGTSKEFVE